MFFSTLYVFGSCFRMLAVILVSDFFLSLGFSAPTLNLENTVATEKSMPHEGECNLTQGRATLPRGVQPYPGECNLPRGVQSYPGEYNLTQGSTTLPRGSATLPRGVQPYPGECNLTQPQSTLSVLWFLQLDSRQSIHPGWQGFQQTKMQRKINTKTLFR